MRRGISRVQNPFYGRTIDIIGRSEYGRGVWVEETNVDQSHNAHVSDVDAVIVGAGFSGLYMLHRLRELGFTTRVFEAAEGVGGTWYWNRYPGARCDSESHYYCYSFSDEIRNEWQWSCRYPAQPEILEYLNFVADRLDLKKDIEFGTRLTTGRYDESAHGWVVETDRGETVRARFLISGVGNTSTPSAPSIPGLESFAGKVYHTALWPHEKVDFTGQRVGLIGTGSSGIQSTPMIAGEAAHLTVFQRTANYSVPARNHNLTEDMRQQLDQNYAIRVSSAHDHRRKIMPTKKTSVTDNKISPVLTFLAFSRIACCSSMSENQGGMPSHDHFTIGGVSKV